MSKINMEDAEKLEAFLTKMAITMGATIIKATSPEELEAKVAELHKEAKAKKQAEENSNIKDVHHIAISKESLSAINDFGQNFNKASSAYINGDISGLDYRKAVSNNLWDLLDNVGNVSKGQGTLSEDDKAKVEAEYGEK